MIVRAGGWWRAALVAFGVVLGGAGVGGAQPCEPGWGEGLFGYPGIDGEVRAACVWNDGTGEALYIGGNFSIAGGVPASHLARWDGDAWSPVGGGTSGTVYALEVFDDGRGPALYAAGAFDRAGGRLVARIARWDGADWELLAGGISGRVDDLEVFDSGAGPRLYAVGFFTRAGGVTVDGRAVWDGTTWTPMAGDLDVDLHTLRAFEGDPAGPALYGASVMGLWRWDGAAWAEIPRPVGPFVWDLAIADTGAGEQLHLGGRDGVARWDGVAWELVGDGLGERVNTLLVHDDGSGPRLYAGGEFDSALGGAVGNVAVFDGTDWTPMGDGLNGTVWAMASFDDGTETLLYAGGFVTATGDGRTAPGVAAWDGLAWAPVGSGLVDGVWSVAPRDEDGREVVYAGGVFLDAGGDPAGDRVARWEDGAWSALGQGLDNRVNVLEWLDDGTGEALFAGGRFENSGGTPVHHVARWDGSTWTPIGDGINAEVHDLAVFDDGTGPALYAAAGVVIGTHINWMWVWKFDGTNWEKFGDRFTGSELLSLAVYDDGDGPTLYAGGWFDMVASEDASNVARWDGVEWRPVADGAPSIVYELITHDDGSGVALYATGAPGGGVQRWDGTAWTTLTGVLDRPVSSLASVNGPDGRRLLAGKFAPTFDPIVIDVLSWDGFEWTPLPGLLNGSVRAIEGLGEAAFIGGDFRTAGGAGSAFVARWGCEATPCPADLDGDGELTLFDFLAFQNAFDAGDPVADFDGDGSLTIFDFLAFQNAFDLGCP